MENTITSPRRFFLLPAKLDRFLIFTVVALFAAYKLHDFSEPFAYGHARWSDAYLYWFGMMHLDLGLHTTMLMNVEGIMDTGELIYYRSIGPLEGMVHALFIYMFNGAHWAVRIPPLIGTFIIFHGLFKINRRFSGLETGVILALLFFTSPFILKYGSSDAGFLSLPLSLGVLGWLSYLRFLENDRPVFIYSSMACFAIGVLSNWQAGFMALPVFIHILLFKRPFSWSITKLAVFCCLMLFAIGAVLLQQGVVTGDYYYPIKRVVERSAAVDNMGDSLTWLRLLTVQARRAIDYFGLATCFFFLYWLARNLISSTLWKGASGWIFSFVLTGLFYGFLFRNAAFIHDFLMLPFLPGVMLGATAGVFVLYSDLNLVLPSSRKRQYLTSTLPIAALLALQLYMGVHSAVIFEEKETTDIANGEASVALYLSETLSDKHLLVADRSSGYHPTSSSKGEIFGNLKPHLAYLTRRPVRYIRNNQDLEELLDQNASTGKIITLVKLNHGPFAGSVKVPEKWVMERHDFSTGSILFLKY
jgi:hypothetical protein